MKKNIYRFYISIASLLVILILGFQNWNCSGLKPSNSNSTDTIYTNQDLSGWQIEINFTRGTAHNHPMMAIWITDTNYKFIENIYVAKSIAKGVFSYSDKSEGKWLPGPIRRPAALPVWAHCRNIKEKDGLFIPTKETALYDGVTGATPQNNFVVYSKTPKDSPEEFDIYFEINQTWDWNEYWTNNKYPEDDEYKTSCQPALIYKARININDKDTWSKFELIGNAHYNGSDGKIYDELKSITTAKEITLSIRVRVP